MSAAEARKFASETGEAGYCASVKPQRDNMPSTTAPQKHPVCRTNITTQHFAGGAPVVPQHSVNVIGLATPPDVGNREAQVSSGINLQGLKSGDTSCSNWHW